jgi:hypothetical protein|tara:strand:+ start:238 stop:630 length:393 start_codon:yes stop_codon:yes gene_type:complete
LISLTLLFAPINSLKLKLWNLTPYDYTYILEFPNNFNKKSLLSEVNRNQINSFLDKNIKRNLLNINFWNRKLIIESYDKYKNKNFEKSFINLYFLTKNNKEKSLDLKKYFILNFDFFSKKNKNIIIKNYN